MSQSASSSLSSALARQLNLFKSSKDGQGVKTQAGSPDDSNFQDILGQAQNNLSGNLFSSSTTASIGASTIAPPIGDVSGSSDISGSDDSSTGDVSSTSSDGLSGMNNHLNGISSILKKQIVSLSIKQMQKTQQNTHLPPELEDDLKLVGARTPLTKEDVDIKASAFFYYGMSLISDLKGIKNEKDPKKDEAKVGAIENKVVIVAYSLSVFTADYHSEHSCKCLADMTQAIDDQTSELADFLNKIMASIKEGKPFEFVKNDPSSVVNFDHIPKDVLATLVPPEEEPLA
ncbi:MAG: hypothetical protein EXS67_00170 [Candidatus Margulisbacteria bacterium]|nr:hypothetical protein [Candidatus Margulisiibacteriota bacterium]